MKLELRKIEAPKIEGMEEMALNIASVTQRLITEMQKQEELLLKQQQQHQELQQETRYDYPEEEGPQAPNQRYDLPPEVNLVIFRFGGGATLEVWFSKCK